MIHIYIYFMECMHYSYTYCVRSDTRKKESWWFVSSIGQSLAFIFILLLLLLLRLRTTINDYYWILLVRLFCIMFSQNRRVEATRNWDVQAHTHNTRTRYALTYTAYHYCVTIRWLLLIYCTATKNYIIEKDKR